MILLRDVIERNEALYPNSLHSVFGDRRLTFQQFATRARKLADGLYRLGLRHQERVAILAMNCLEFLEAYAVAELSGVILATVNWRLAPLEIALILNDSAPKALIFESQYANLVDRLKPELRGIEHFICITDPTAGPAPPGALSYEEVLAAGDANGAPIRAGKDDILCLIYTGGTTGRPKGCKLTHAGHAFMADQSACYQGMVAGDSTLIVAPLFHVGARSQQMPMHVRGGTVVILRAFDPALILRTIERQRMTHVHMVPTMVQRVLELPDNERYDTSSLKCILYAAAPMPVPVLKRAIARFGRILINGWGSTESGNGSAFPSHLHRPDGTPAEVKRLGSVGQPTVGTEVRAGDHEGREMPRGQIGELLIRSPSTMRGYWNNDAATIDAVRNGWLHTGDMGYVDEEGYIFLVDRKKDMIISGGENIYCQEVEDALIDHPGLSEVAVIGVPDEKWGEAVKAIAVRTQGSFGSRTFLSLQGTHRWLQVSEVHRVFTDELQRLPSGKVKKVLLRQRYAN